jgi:hypothetical protein
MREAKIRRSVMCSGMARFLVSFDGRELDAAARERLTAAGGELVAELVLAADGSTDVSGQTPGSRPTTPMGRLAWQLAIATTAACRQDPMA